MCRALFRKKHACPWTVSQRGFDLHQSSRTPCLTGPHWKANCAISYTKAQSWYSDVAETEACSSECFILGSNLRETGPQWWVVTMKSGWHWFNPHRLSILELVWSFPWSVYKRHNPRSRLYNQDHALPVTFQAMRLYGREHGVSTEHNRNIKTYVLMRYECLKMQDILCPSAKERCRVKLLLWFSFWHRNALQCPNTLCERTWDAPEWFKTFYKFSEFFLSQGAHLISRACLGSYKFWKKYFRR